MLFPKQEHNLIQKVFDDDIAATLVHALVTSRLDNENTLL